MKFLVSLCIVFLIGIVLSTKAFAHLAGQPPFFKMNGKLSDLYPVMSNANFPEFQLPQDLAPDNYLVNEPIDFEVDTKELQKIVPLDVIEKTKFVWDFGDGQKGEGLANSHTYTKKGSFVLSIKADTSAIEKGVEPQLIQSVLLHVLPDRDYKLPKAVIKVNGKEENKDPANNVFEVNFGEQISFDGSDSIAPSSRIVSYFWDFDDGGSSKEQRMMYQYELPREFASPALRVVDENGFIADAYVGLRNNPGVVNKVVNTVVPDSPNPRHFVLYGFFVAVGGLLLVIGFYLRKKKRTTGS